jgi:hypothetical protein
MSAEHSNGLAHSHLELVPDLDDQLDQTKPPLELVEAQSEEEQIELNRLHDLRLKIYELIAEESDVVFRFGEDRYVGRFGKVPIFFDDNGTECVSIKVKHSDGCHNTAHRTETLAKASLWFGDGKE